jgi:hypothetical protein
LTEEEKRAAKARAAEEKLAAKQAKEAEKTKTTGEQRKSKEITASEPAAVNTDTPRDNEDLYQEPALTEAEPTPEHDSADPTSPTSQGSSKGFKSLLSKLKAAQKKRSQASLVARLSGTPSRIPNHNLSLRKALANQLANR